MGAPEVLREILTKTVLNSCNLSSKDSWSNLEPLGGHGNLTSCKFAACKFCSLRIGLTGSTDEGPLETSDSEEEEEEVTYFW